MSSETDLDSGPGESESLDAADREARNEQRFVPEGPRPDESIEDEDRFEGSGDADEVVEAEPPGEHPPRRPYKRDRA